MEPKCSPKAAKLREMKPQGEPKGAPKPSSDATGTPQDAPDASQDTQGIENGAKMDDKRSQMEPNEPNLMLGATIQSKSNKFQT